MKALTDKIIERLQDKHDRFIGSQSNKVTQANNEGYKQGLLNAIEVIKIFEIDAEFDEIARVMMKHLANPEKYHPHHIVVIDSTSAQLLEGKHSTGLVMDYITD